MVAAGSEKLLVMHGCRLASPTAVARPADHLHLEPGGDDIELLGDVFADHMKRAIAARALSRLRLDHHLLARQVRRQGTPVAPGRGALAGRRLDPRRFPGRLRRGERLLDVFQGKVQLVGIQTLRTLAVNVTLQLLQQEMQLLHLHLRRPAARRHEVVVGSNLRRGRLARQQQCDQFVLALGPEAGGGRIHDPRLTPGTPAVSAAW